MAQTKFRKIYPFVMTIADKEKPTGPSQTVIDETYTVRELVTRANQGFYPVQPKPGVWDPDANLDSHDLEKVQHLTLAEKQEIINQTKSDVERMNKDIEDSKVKIAELQKKQQAQHEAYMLDLMEKKLATRSPAPPKSSSKTEE